MIPWPTEPVEIKIPGLVDFKWDPKHGPDALVSMLAGVTRVLESARRRQQLPEKKARK